MERQQKNNSRSRRQKNRRFTLKMQKKMMILFITIAAVLVGLNIRITYINAKSGDKYTKQVLSQQQYDSRTIPYKRGDILDRNQTVLATSEKVYNIVLDCYAVNADEDYAEPTVHALTSIFGLEESEIRKLLTDEETMESRYQILKKGISIDQKKAYEDYKQTNDEMSAEAKKERKNVQGIWFEEDYVRTYPFSTLASNLLGFSNSNNDGNTGIEGQYNNILNGVNGREFGYLNEDLQLQRTVIDAENGNTLVTTIDYNIQSVVEKYIQEFQDANANGPRSSLNGKGSQETSVVVANPQTGEIYAMATSNNYDLNNPQDLTSYFSKEEIDAMDQETLVSNLTEVWSNFPVNGIFEPGSTYKPFTVAAGLETGVLTGRETYVCEGVYTPAGTGNTAIKCNDENGHGTLTLEGIIMQSCNVGMMKIAEQMGISEYVRYQDIFQFGLQTGIDLPGEAAGSVKNFDSVPPISQTDLMVSAFGQTVEVSMIQELAAFSSVINGGYYYQPYVVKQVLDDKGRVTKDTKPTLLKQTISAETSEILKGYLHATVAEGTGGTAGVDGYAIGGKTGTAETHPRENGEYIVSFIGFAPVEDPQVVVYVVVNRPNVEQQADSKHAQKIAKNIFSEILPYLNIFSTQDNADIGDDNRDDTSGDTEGQAGDNNTENDQDGVGDSSLEDGSENGIGSDSLSDDGYTQDDGYSQDDEDPDDDSQDENEEDIQ